MTAGRRTPTEATTETTMTTEQPDDAFWTEARARAEAERGTEADPSACGTCRTRTEQSQQVEHDGCARRATLLQAPDHPGYELITGLPEDELAALPPRFHVPVYIDTATPKGWVCAVCWGDGWCTQWPCPTAQEHGTKVFTPAHDAEQERAKTTAELIQLRAELAAVDEAIAEFVDAAKSDPRTPPVALYMINLLQQARGAAPAPNLDDPQALRRHVTEAVTR